MKIELIAEVSTNHGGDLALAKEFIKRYAPYADWIKFQHTRVRHLRPDDPQYAWFQRAELSVEQFAELKACCEAEGTRFLTTVFNAADVPDVLRLKPTGTKIGSGEAGEERLAGLVLHGEVRRVFVSTGLMTPHWAYEGGWDPTRVERFRCVTRYPAPPLACVQAPYGYGTKDMAVGWSDHCVGIDVATAAIYFGARIIEKHVQLPHQARPAKPWEATVAEFEQLRAFADEDPSWVLGRWQHA